MDNEKMLDQQTLTELREIGTDDPTFFKKLLETFLQSLTERIAPIGSAISINSAEKLALESHALKSSCYSLGAKKLGDFCSQLESLGKSGGTEGAQTLFNSLQQEAELVRIEIAGLPEMKI